MSTIQIDRAVVAEIFEFFTQNDFPYPSKFYTSLEAALQSQAAAKPIKEVVVHADYREMWRQQLKMNQQLCAALNAPNAAVKPECNQCKPYRNACGELVLPLCRCKEPQAAAEPVDPMDWPLPCDVTVGHGTMNKGVKLRTLVMRMKSLYEMATGQNADEVAGRTMDERLTMGLQAATVKELTDQDPNAPWLTEAHALCSYMGIPQGHITDRIRALRDKLGAAEPVGNEIPCQHCNETGRIEYYDGSDITYEQCGYCSGFGYTTPPETQFNPNWSLLEVTQKSLTERTATLKRALVALKEAQGDINWMLNMQAFLNGDVFDYLDAAVAEIEALGVKA